MRGYDKWQGYLALYKHLMLDVEPGSAYLEIGVQNMGWLAALDEGGKFSRGVACDIDPAVMNFAEGTRYTDVVVGDSTKIDTADRIRSLGLEFGLIVDDGSHTQHDVILNFLIYWPLLSERGHFVIEDCHTDFSPEYGRDNYFGASIFEFFASLASLPTMLALDDELKYSNLGYRTIRRFFSQEFSDQIASSLKEISFTNSCIVLRKGDSSLGQRILSGDEWPVASRESLSAFSLAALRNTLRIPQSALAVVYLNRVASANDGAAQDRFIRGYVTNPPQVTHQLYVVNKGFAEEELVEQYRLFDKLLPVFINVEDSGTDLSTYREAAMQIHEPVAFFMNTYAEPIHARWLDMVYEAFASSPNAGLAGCSASVETLAPFCAGFPDFPNFHIRTNAFMMKTCDYLAVTTGRSLEGKEDAYRLESGPQSITWLTRASGREVVVVGSRGAVQPRHLWRTPIFRTGRQSQLLVGDNQSRAYLESPLVKRLRLWAFSQTRLALIFPARVSYELRRWGFWRLALRLAFGSPRRKQGLKRKTSRSTTRALGASAQRQEASRPTEIERQPLVVLIPTHKEVPSDSEVEVLKHNARMLAAYPIEIVLPDDCSPTWYETFFAESGVDGRVRLVDSAYFGSIAAVNRMGMDPNFYRLFRRFEFLLICHLDAWIMHSAIDEWLDSPYDFIGAPLFLPADRRRHFSRGMAPIGGNGGLSLRRVEACIRTLEGFKPAWNIPRIAQALIFLARNGQLRLASPLLRFLRQLRGRDWVASCRTVNLYEDVFFTVVAPLCGDPIRIPPSRDALRFACEVNYELIQKEILIDEPPLGVHGFNKYVAENYFDHVRAHCSRRQSLLRSRKGQGYPLTVSVIMIVRDLVAAGRLEVFDQAVSSVINQTYEYVEVLIVDGGSQDGTIDLVRQRYGQSDQIRIYQEPDNSVWEGMANGVALAKGDLVSVLNSDDFFTSPEALEKLVHAISSSDADMAYGHTILSDHGHISPFPTHLPSVLNCFGIVHQATLIKKDVLEVIQPFDSPYITRENFLFVTLLMEGYRCVEVPETIVCYRTGGVSSAMYGGANLAGTIDDYVCYMKAVTSIGHYLSDAEIAALYGFRGISELRLRGYLRLLIRIRDRRLRRFLLQGTYHWLCRRGLRRFAMAKVRFTAAKWKRRWQFWHRDPV